MSDTLVSPLGRSPGAVSGMYFAFQQRKVEISHVVTVGTSHPDVLVAARSYLSPLFEHLGVRYTTIHLPEEELRSERRSVGPYAGMMGFMVQQAIQEGNQVHVAVTGGRSGMGALAALAAQLYGAHHLWHLWVPVEIEQGGTVDLLAGLLTGRQMAASPYLNPTVWGDDAWSLVELPFIDLSWMQEVLRVYQRTGQPPDWSSEAVRQAFNLDIHTTFESFARVFPAGFTFEDARKFLAIKRQFGTAKNPEERENALLELGELLQRAGVVDHRERARLVNLLRSDGTLDELLGLGQSDLLKFWNWLRVHKEDIVRTATVADFLLNALELWLKLNKVIS